MCTGCAAGQFQSNTGQHECVVCPANFYQSARNRSTCAECPYEFYAQPSANGCEARSGVRRTPQIKCSQPTVNHRRLAENVVAMPTSPGL